MKTRLFMMFFIGMLSSIGIAYALDVGEPVVNATSEGLSIQKSFGEFYGIKSNYIWYIVIGAGVALFVIWRLTLLHMISVLGIFIIVVAFYFLFPPLCTTITEVFETHCGTDEQFFGVLPFSLGSLGFGIILLIHSFKSKTGKSMKKRK